MDTPPRPDDTLTVPSGACTKAPAGWHCTRDAGHDGPCAADRMVTPWTTPGPSRPTRKTPRPAPVYDPERTARVIGAMTAEVERIGGEVRRSPGYVHFHIQDLVRLDVCVTLIGTDELLRIVLQQLADVVRVGRDAARPAGILGAIG